MNNEDDIKQLTEQLYQAEVLYEWQYKGAGRKATRIAIQLMLIFVFIFIFTLIWLMVGEINKEALILNSINVLIFFMAHYLFFPDKHYCYHLTTLGIHYTTQDMIPDVAYTIARGFAWLGVVVCIVAVVVLGPLSLVGAGAFALLSFSMTNFRSEATKLEVLIASTSVVYDIGNDNMLRIQFPKRGAGFEFIGNIYTSSAEEKAELLRQLNIHFPHLQVIKVNRYKETERYYEDFPVLGEDESILDYMQTPAPKLSNDEQRDEKGLSN